MKHITIMGPGIIFEQAKPDGLCRIGCRAIIERDGRILFSYLQKRNQFLLPGGGIDHGDTEESCVVRECREELGMQVFPLQKICIVDDCYVDRWFRNIYFSVRVDMEGFPTEFVEEENLLGLKPVWLDKDGLQRFLLSQTIDLTMLHAAHRLTVLNSHYREMCALSIYLGLELPPLPQELVTTIQSVHVAE